jgi:hypothetical protein
MLFSCGETQVAGVVVVFSSFAVGTICFGCGVLRNRNHLSTKKSASRRNSCVNALGHGSSQLGVGAKLLAQADQEQGTDDGVNMSFHCVTWLSAWMMARPMTSATCGTTAFPRHRNLSTRLGTP